MKASFYRFGARLGGGVLAAAIGLAGAPAAMAQTAAAAPAAKLSGPGSISGVWFNSSFSTEREGPPSGEPRTRRTIDGQPPPMLPWAAAVVADKMKAFREGRPIANMSANCVPNGVPQMMFLPPQLPMQIIESPGQVTILFEYFNTFRNIYLDAQHDEDPDPTYMGNSVGHWEGDTLVVDTIAITDKTTVEGVIPHTLDLHVVERFRRTSADTLEILITVEDPKTFTKPYTYISPLKRVPGMKIQEYVCENNRNIPDASGRTGIQMPTAGN
jgi:hypothetical protein